jgi:PAS domain-containing protein
VGEDKQAVILELYERCRGTIDKLAGALAQRLRAAASDGQGAFFAAMLCFGAAAFLFHLSLLPQRINQRYLEGAISAEQEPLRGESHPVLAGLLLPQRQQQDLLACQGGKPTQFLEALDSGYRAFTRSYFASASAPPNYRFTQLIRQRPTHGVGYAWTDSAGSTLILPSVVAAAARTAQLQPIEDCPATPDDLGCKVYALYRDPIIRSLAIEQLMSPNPTPEPRPEPARYVVMGWYFISVEGVERSVPRWRNPEVMPADHLYSGTSYFYSTLSRVAPAWAAQPQCGDPFRAWTAPYFDLTGNGVVKSVCYPVSDPDATAPVTVGVLCADLSLPTQLIMDQLQQASATLDLSLVNVVGEQATACSQDPDPCPASLSRVPADTATRFARQVVADNKRENSILGAEGVRLFGDYFGAVVMTGAGDSKMVIVGKIRRSRYRDVVSLLGSSGFLFVGFCVLMMSYRSQMRRREAVLARGLPQGVLQLDDKQRILGANDRAEEIFGLALPGLGIDAIADGDRQAIWFESLFVREHCVMISSDEVLGEFRGEPDKLDTTGFLAPGRCSEVLERIEHGYTLSFYARTSARWVRINASPIVKPDLRIGIVVIVSTHLEAAHRPYLGAFELAQA